MRRIYELHDEPIPPWAVRLVSWMLGISAFARGLDYWQSAGGTEPLRMVEAIAPLSTWGVAITAIATVLLAGLATRVHELVWVGHVACAGAYFMLTTATAQAVIPTGHGYRAIGPLATVTTLHILLAVVRGPIPKGSRR
jgi:hypothetical protein